MIAALIGEVFRVHKNSIILLTGGVGYAVYVPENLLAKHKIGDKISLFIHTHVRDDAIELFGFGKDEELELFELLLTVSGVGPRTALLVADRGVSEIEKAVLDADVDFFTTIPRLGKKNAQKIIIELKSKLGSLNDIDLKDASDGETKQVNDALQMMGFARKEIIVALKGLTAGDTTIEQKVRHALQLLAKR